MKKLCFFSSDVAVFFQVRGSDVPLRAGAHPACVDGGHHHNLLLCLPPHQGTCIF